MKSLQLIFLSLLSGLLLGCSWYFNMSFLIFVGLVPLLFVEDYFSSNKSLIKRSSLKLWALSYLTFLTWNLIVTWWVVNASLGGALMAFIANSLLMSWVFLIFHKLKLTYKSVWILIPIYLAWEHGHTLWDISWTWLTLGNVFAYHPNWIQWYEFTGVSGGSLWVLGVNIFIFQLIRHKRVTTLLSKPIYQLAALILFPILISFAVLYYRAGTLANKQQGEQCVIVQPNLDPYNVKFYTEFSEQFLNMLNQVRGKITYETRYLILPETFMINDMNEDHLEDYEEINWFKDSLLKAFPKLNIITGASTYKFYKTKAEASLTARLDMNSNMYYDMYNSAILLNTIGVSFYHKSKLVPGVEKMPFPLILKPLEKLAINLQGTVGSLGTQSERTNLTCNNGVKVGPIICYESVYGDFCTGYSKNGANLLAIVTNDGWWGNTPGYKQHLSYARLRAIELRKQIVRSANTGVSAFVDEFGGIHQATEYEQKAVITVNAKSNDIKTFFARMGDLISYASVLFSLCLIVFGVYLKYSKAAK